MRTATRHRRGLLGFVAIAAIALTIPAGTAAAAPQKVKNACGLLEASEIEGVFGLPVEDGEEISDLAGTGTQCEWQIGDPDGTGENGTLTTRLHRGSGPTGPKAAHDVGKKLALEEDGAEVDGLGRDAYYEPFSGTFGVLKNKKTGLFVSATVFASGATQVEPEVLKPQLEELAEIATERA